MHEDVQESKRESFVRPLVCGMLCDRVRVENKGHKALSQVMIGRNLGNTCGVASAKDHVVNISYCTGPLSKSDLGNLTLALQVVACENCWPLGPETCAGIVRGMLC